MSAGEWKLSIHTYISEHEFTFAEVELSCPQPSQVEVVSVIRFVWDVLHNFLEMLESSLLLGAQVTHIPTHCCSVT